MNSKLCNPKIYKRGSFCIKSIILICTILTAYFFMKLATDKINWKSTLMIFGMANDIWVGIIMFIGFCCGIVFMWLFHKPDTAWFVSMIDNPGAIAHLMVLVLIKIRTLEWEKYIKEIDFNFLKGDSNNDR